MAAPRLLLADDHAMFVQTLAKLLSSKFELVDIVENGRALCESSLKHKPDVILTDITMPLMNGIEAVRRLRKEGDLTSEWPPARVVDALWALTAPRTYTDLVIECGWSLADYERFLVRTARTFLRLRRG